MFSLRLMHMAIIAAALLLARYLLMRNAWLYRTSLKRPLLGLRELDLGVFLGHQTTVGKKSGVKIRLNKVLSVLDIGIK